MRYNIAEQESFGMDDVMEVLVTDTFPIQSDMVVELQGDGKAWRRTEEQGAERCNAKASFVHFWGRAQAKRTQDTYKASLIQLFQDTNNIFIVV